jgi:hypothetical protein
VSHREAHREEKNAEGKEGKVPAERGAEVVADMLDAEDLVVDEPFDEVECTPAGEQDPAAISAHGEFAGAVTRCRGSSARNGCASRLRFRHLP